MIIVTFMTGVYSGFTFILNTADQVTFASVPRVGETVCTDVIVKAVGA